MKKILITGEGSYIGTSFAKWLNNYPGRYSIDTISTLNNAWKDYDFSKYDVVFDVAGIAHIKITPDMEELFYKVNRDMTVAICQKAKIEGVSQFIFLSSMNVFGDTSEIITEETQPQPINFYGKSKLQADIAIQKMNCDNFKVVSIRPPVVYGKGCKGNYNKLSMLVQRFPFFPDFKNTRSMLYIDNLCEFIRMIIDYKVCGIFHPQNKECTSTMEIVDEIAKVYNKKIVKSKLFNSIIRVLLHKNHLINRVFADDYYSKEISRHFDYEYCVVNFQNSIRNTELPDEN